MRYVKLERLSRKILRLPIGATSRLATSPPPRWLRPFIIASIVTLCGTPARQWLARSGRINAGLFGTEGPLSLRERNLHPPSLMTHYNPPVDHVFAVSPYNSGSIQKLYNHLLTRTRSAAQPRGSSRHRPSTPSAFPFSWLIRRPIIF